MSNIHDDVKEAERLGISYGKYKALTRARQPPQADEARKQEAGERAGKRRRKKWDDRQAFKLWQERKSDAEIGRILGVSRALIQRWRDVMELPSPFQQEVDTGQYRLVETKEGMFAICEEIEKKE